MAALMAVASFATSSASAEPTALCSADESTCAEAHLITHVHQSNPVGSKAVLKTNLLTVKCDNLFLGDTVGAAGNPFLIEANFTYSNCNNGCTVTEESPHAEVQVLKLGHETADVTDEFELHVNCSGFINCEYNGEGLEGTAKGPLLSSHEPGEILFTEQPVTKVGGILCPKETTLSATTMPLTATYIATAPPVPTKEENYGLGNPGNTNVCKVCKGDPIDTATGNLSESQTDLSLNGRGPSLQITRSYNSQLAASQTSAGIFGYGWTGPYSASLTIDSEAGTATVNQDNGSTTAFVLNEGKYSPSAWSQATLAKSGENYIYTLPNQEQLEFNNAGQLIKVIDRHKNALTLTYKEGKLETVKDAASRTLTFAYGEGKVKSVKDPMGHEVKYTYESGNLATVTLPGEESARWKFKYDTSHRLTEIANGRGYTTKNEYDSLGRVKLQTDPLTNERKFEYTETGGFKETTIAEPNGSKTLEKFNLSGEPTEVTKAYGTALAQTSKYEYNSSLALTKVTDPNNHVTTYGYDAEGNKTSKKDANENETKWVYNKTHDVIEETTPKGETTTITRNAAGDPETIKRPAPESKTQETKFKYAANGDLEEETDPLDRTTKFEYNSYGNRKALIDPAGDKRTWGYNEDGQITSEVSPRGNAEGAEASKFETKTERDAQGRPIKITDPLGHETKHKYDANGNDEVVTDPNGQATTNVYDADDRLIEVKSPNGDVAKTSYDSEGKVKSKTDGNGNTTKYERNLLEQITEVIDPLERKTIRKYDAAGNLEETKDPESRTITYSYDAGNRLKEINYSSAETTDVSYKHDKDGNVTEMTDGTGTTKKTYDELDRLTEVKNGNGEVVKYGYDLGNQRTKITYPNSESITRSFDSAGRLEKITDWLGGETKFAYNRDSFLESTTFPSGSENKDEYEYNEADQLTKTKMKKGAATLASIAYTRDNAAQLKSATQTELPGAEKPEYEYDAKERLKKGAGTSFGYDAANNPTTLGAAILKYDKASQLEEGNGTKYTFNSMGQRTKASPTKGPVTTYGYDQAGDLTSIKRSKEGEIEEIEDAYAYDGTGLRASEKVSGVKTQLTWDVAEKLPQLLYDGTNYYVYGPEGLPIAQINSKKEPTYLHHDQQGSTRLLTNSKGEAKGTYTYTPFGAIEGQTGTATTPLGYDGQYRNEDTGLVYLRARVYDPSTAQFMSVDPQVGQTGEPYAYAGDNPVNADDPSGELFWYPPYGYGQFGLQLGGLRLGYVGPIGFGPPFFCPYLYNYYLSAAQQAAYDAFWNAQAAFWNAQAAFWNWVARQYNPQPAERPNFDGWNLDDPNFRRP
jgi:RHS repeat-associated protein